jgi:hypothetical protein
LNQAARTMLDEHAWWAKLLKKARADEAQTEQAAA